MASTSAGQRAAIAASFTAQAGIIAAIVAMLAGNAGSPASPSVPAVAHATPPASTPAPPAPQLGQVIGVSVTAAGQEGSTAYPSPVEPVMWVPAASEVVVTVTLTIPPGASLGRFRIGITNGAWRGVPDNGAALVTAGKPRPGQYTYTLHLSTADLSSVSASFLVLTGQADGDPALTAPLAAFVVGPQP
jgi:hypothetical protein